MSEHGYGEEDSERVANLLLKKGLKTNPETQALEDVACLVFLEYYLEPFSVKHREVKVLKILRKTWMKMSDDGHSASLGLALSPEMKALVQRGVVGDETQTLHGQPPW